MDRLDLTADAFLDIVSDGRAAETLSTAAGVPLAFVDLRAPGHRGGHVVHDGDGLASLPCVLVARVGPETPVWWHGLAEQCDVVLADPDPADSRGDHDHEHTDLAVLGDLADIAVIADDEQRAALETTVLANPLAATALALLLRGSASRSIEEGLVAESTVYSMLQAGPEFNRWRSSRTPRSPRPQVGPSVRVQREGDVLHLALSRPQVHNAVDRSVRDGLAEGLELALADDSITRIVLTGDGPSFSSGGDLDEFGSFPDPATSHVTRLTRSPARLVAALATRVPVEVQLHGACMGAGIELPAFANQLIAAADCRIALPELRYGLIPGAGGTVSVTRRIGRHRCAYLGLSGAVVDTATALTWGLVDARPG